MNKRTYNLVLLIAIMLIAIACLCACVSQKQPDTTDESASTTDPGYGVVEWDDVESTEPIDITEETTAPTMQNEIDTTESTKPTDATSVTTPVAGAISYEEYIKLSSEEQRAYALQFPSIDDYITWVNTEKEKYGNSDVIEITGPVDLGEIAGNNG